MKNLHDDAIPIPIHLIEGPPVGPTRVGISVTPDQQTVRLWAPLAVDGHELVNLADMLTAAGYKHVATYPDAREASTVLEWCK